jgi:hypothetical protein
VLIPISLKFAARLILAARDNASQHPECRHSDILQALDVVVRAATDFEERATLLKWRDGRSDDALPGNSPMYFPALLETEWKILASKWDHTNLPIEHDPQALGPFSFAEWRELMSSPWFNDVGIKAGELCHIGVDLLSREHACPFQSVLSEGTVRTIRDFMFDEVNEWIVGTSSKALEAAAFLDRFSWTYRVAAHCLLLFAYSKPRGKVSFASDEAVSIAMTADTRARQVAARVGTRLQASLDQLFEIDNSQAHQNPFFAAYVVRSMCRSQFVPTEFKACVATPSALMREMLRCLGAWLEFPRSITRLRVHPSAL